VGDRRPRSYYLIHSGMGGSGFRSNEGYLREGLSCHDRREKFKSVLSMCLIKQEMCLLWGGELCGGTEIRGCSYKTLCGAR